jgi:hypothetical protein
MAEAEPNRRKWLVVVLLTLPLWLLISAGIGIWLHFKGEEREAREEVARYAKEVSRASLEGDLKTLAATIGERNSLVEAGLTKAAAWIEGTLGPSNAGFTVSRIAGPGGGQWPLLRVTIPGNKPELPAVWLVAAYDSPEKSRGVEAATAVVAELAAAQALADVKPARTIHFWFLPHGNERTPRVAPTLAKLRQGVPAEQPPAVVLCLDAMGAGEELWVSTRDTPSPVIALVGNLGKIVGAEVVCLNDADGLFSELSALGLPAVRVATRAPVALGENDEILPPAERVAAATGRLVELTRRVSALP